MARSIEQVNAYIVDNLVIQFAAIGITVTPLTWSRRNMLRAICYTVAVCQNLMEQLQDLFTQQIEATVAKAFAGSAPWIQDKMFKFQYSSTDPQVVALINLIPTYPVINDQLKIITACSVTSTISSEVTVKIAKGTPLTALDAGQLSAAQSYLNIIGIEGIDYVAISLDSDKIYIDADIYYLGQYSSVIQTNVIAAINDFLKNLSITNFNGKLKMTDLEELIRNIEGVNDVVLKNVRGRSDADLFSAGIDLILNTATLQRQWSTRAGYIGEENTATKTFADTLNFIAE